LLLAGLSLAGIAWAGSSDGTAVDWSLLSGGGAPAESGSGILALNGTLGQTATGVSTGSQASLAAGFWYGLGEGAYQLYLPLVLRNH
jgi:hypothetical protein